MNSEFAAASTSLAPFNSFFGSSQSITAMATENQDVSAQESKRIMYVPVESTPCSPWHCRG